MKYKVLSTIHHDGQPYEENSEIDLTPAEAEPLLLLHIIEKIPTKAPKETN